MSQEINELYPPACYSEYGNESTMCPCLAVECRLMFNESRELMEQCFMDHCFISKRALNDSTLIQVTAVYVILLAIGLIGNICTCIVIRKHPLLNGHSSAYLLNLALSDLVTLCVGLPFEIFMNWHQYPWPFPDIFCNLKGLIAETTSSVSILTILLFSIERYFAICHPFIFVKLKPVRKNVVLFLLGSWILSIACASPYAMFHKAEYLFPNWPFSQDDLGPVLSSKVCMMSMIDPARGPYTFMMYLFHFSAIAFFFLPLIIILVLYILIARRIMQVKSRQRVIVRCDSNVTQDEGPLRITMILTSVVIAFFVCYLPFQFQRLAFFHFDYLTLNAVNQYLYFTSGFLFYLATIINPILYNLVSSRFRRASREVLLSFCRCERPPLDKYSIIKYHFSSSVKLVDRVQSTDI